MDANTARRLAALKRRLINQQQYQKQQHQATQARIDALELEIRQIEESSGTP